MSTRLWVYWAVIAVVYWVIAFLFNGLFFANWGLTWQQGLIGVLLGFFAGAFLDLFMSSLEDGGTEGS